MRYREQAHFPRHWENFMGYGLGIDLGTTFTGAAVVGDTGTTMVPLGRDGVVEPSVVFAAADGTLLTGDAAVDASGDAPQRVARGFKRRLGDPTPLVVGGAAFSPAALLAAQLREVLTRVEKSAGSAPESIVLTCPAVWGPYRREHFDEVPRLTGLAGAVIVTEPEAAATHYAAERRLGAGELVAVYDLGGGTFDTTILRAQDSGMEIVGTPEGIERLGGMDFDEALFAHVDDALGGALSGLDPADPDGAAVLASVRQACVRAKEELSVEPDVTIRAALPGGDREVVVTRLAFNDMIRPSVELTTESLHRTIASAGLTPRDLAAVLLAGGSSRIPLVGQVVSEAFGRPVRAGLHPKFTVALGAAAIAAKRLERARPVVPPPAPAPVAAPPAVRRRKLVVPAVVAAAVIVGGGVVAIATSGGDTGGTPGPQVSANAAAKPSGPVASVAVPTVADTITGTGKRPQGVGVTPDGSKVYVPSSVSNTISVIDRASRRIVQTITTPAPPQYIAVGKGRAFVTLLGPGNAVAVIDTTLDQIVGTVPAGNRMFVPAITPDGKRLFVPDQESSLVLAVDPAARTSATFSQVPPGPRGVAVDGAGKRLYVVSIDSSQVTAIDAESSKILGSVRVGNSSLAIALTPDGKHAYTANYDANSVSVIDTETLKVTATVPVGGHPLAVTSAPDGKHLYVANNADGTVSVVDTGTNAVTATVPVGKEPWSIAVSPDGQETFVSNALGDSVTVLNTGA
ncbi:Hsp70 family protein [Actinokineospora sp. NBRC 105648]|uniref:Hsp70 family protein n=1 Tax=Actinokineospora sp. NBRC 105648 TaxID=3032206 RepID=UPI0024A46819|nr:Hsp70 family protein [Actinokineospora sp. NBRC 105648]GLZ38952.1 hypothetical protein Acsp05_25760 [Actinokineospora sp. NBRC 105648]